MYTFIKGYEGTGDTDGSCTEINQCDFPGLFTCPFNATCTELTFAEGDYQCDCIEGFEKINVYCRDINECDGVDHICDADAECINTDGSYTCACQTGFSGTGTGGDCVNIDECDPGLPSPCDGTAICVDTEGSYTCGCAAGFFSTGGVCNDIDECQNGDHNCCTSAGCFCTNDINPFTCGCDEGYDGDGFLLSIGGAACTNSDECTSATHNCDIDNNAACTDTTGGFECFCPGNSEGDGILVADGGVSCTDVDECEPCDTDVGTCLCSENADCTNLPNTYNCECVAGFTGDGTTCLDLNECDLATDNCDENAECINTIASFSCVCSTGFTGDGETCADDDECLLGTPCDNTANSECVNNDGGFTCDCVEGFVKIEENCLDLDECFEDPAADGAHQCPVNSECVNTPGTYECECDTGYTGTFVTVETFSCSNHDECTFGSLSRKRRAVGDDVCPVFSDCLDTEGSFECTCQDGFQFSADETACIDVNECTSCFGTGSGCVCGENAECTNTVGSFTCACTTGFEFLANNFDCGDIDDCDENANCPDHSECVNTSPSYHCECDEGYQKNAADDLCVDTNECIPCDSDPRDYFNCGCDPSAFCINTDGSFECWCPLGWWMSEEECVDVDECDAPEFLEAQGEWDDAAAANATGHYTDPMGDDFISIGRRSAERDFSETLF